MKQTHSPLPGPALGEVGEAMRELSEVKDSLDMEVKQNFIDPLQNLHDKDLREIQVSATSPLGSKQFECADVGVLFLHKTFVLSLLCAVRFELKTTQLDKLRLTRNAVLLPHYYDWASYEYYI